MRSKIKITSAKKDDFKQIVDLLDEISESIRSKRGWSNYTLNTKRTSQRNIFQNILNSESKIFVARKNNEIIGLINMQIINNIRHGWKRAHLEEVVVRNDFRRKGVGTKMLSAVIEFCKKKNISVIKLLCGRQLNEGQQFYEKNGFLFTDKGYRLEIK